MTKNAVFRSLNVLQTIKGVDYRLFFFILIAPMALFQMTNALFPALLLFAVLFFAARAATASDPQMLRILLNSTRFAARYDPAKLSRSRRRSRLRLDDLFRAHDESQPFRTLLNLFGFFTDRHCLSKGGDVGLFIEFSGRDAECLSAEEKQAQVAAIRTALLAFDGNYEVKQYLLKRSHPNVRSSRCGNAVVDDILRSREAFLRSRGEETYSYRTILSVFRKADWVSPKWTDRVVYAFRHPAQAVRQMFRAESRIVVLDETIENAKRSLDRAVQSFLEQTADTLHGRVLSKQEAFRFLRELLNPNREKAHAVGLTSDLHVDYFLPDSVLECHRGHLRFDDYFVKTLTLKQLPPTTFADMLSGLRRVSGNLTVVLDWSFIEDSKATALVNSKRKFLHATKSSWFSGALSERPIERETLYDEANEALIADLGKFKVERELNGARAGELTLSVILAGLSLDAVEQTAAEVMKAVGALEGAMNEERYSSLNAFLSALPGGYPFNLRKLIATNQNHADLGFWFLPAQGEDKNPFLGKESLITFETEDKSLYPYNPHVGDTGHMVLFGRTGGGKSFWLNTTLTHAQKYSPITVLFDIGGSYKWLATLLRASYIEITPDSIPLKIGPFCRKPTPQNLERLRGWVRMLAESDDTPITADDDRDLYESIKALYLLEPEHRRLLTLSTTVKPSLGRRIKRWTEGEQYGEWFDHAEDEVGEKFHASRFLCVDFNGMQRLGAVLEPLLYDLLLRCDDHLHNPAHSTVFKQLVIDEAWRFFKHPVTCTYIEEALRTLRKANTSVVLATQSVEDLARSEVLRPVLDNCPTKIIFGNPTLDPAVYGEVLGLTETEQARVRTLKLKKQFLLKREAGSKVLNLNVDPRSHWLFTTNPFEAERRQKAVEQCGSIQSALDYLTGEKQ